ncbi:MAG: ABC transporter substrate-binding protein [Acetobacteraceae bacterium]|nr:ABC transporter substrate-binding protein [Acetobacteraceae bacterium]
MKRWIALAMVLAVLAALWGCTRPEAKAPAEPIKVGFLACETGAFSSYGQDNVRGARLFEEEISARGGVGGRPLQLVVYNTESTPARAVAGARKLIEEDKVVAIVGLALVSEMNAVAPLVQNGPICYSTCSAYQPEHKMIFATGVFIPLHHACIAEYLRDKGLKKFALITTNDATGEVAEAGLRRAAERNGLEVVAAERMNPADVDASAQVARIASRQPQAVVVWIVGKPLGVALRAIKTVGLNVPVFTSHGNRSLEFLRGLADIEPPDFYMPCLVDAIWEHLPESHPARALNASFHERYVKKYGSVPGSGSNDSYDALALLCRAFEAVGTDSAKVVAYLEGVKGYQGLAGSYDFSPEDHRGLGRDDIMIARVKAGVLTPAP